MNSLTPREVARFRLLAREQGVKASDLLPPGTDLVLETKPETLIALADEYEAVVHHLLAIMRTEGLDSQAALKMAFLGIDTMREVGPPD